ncbi:MAG TPA: hypothetical protein VK886_20730 [Vicinamibacterales bacterium]|nr:hypothetical protein [Vicinamibacterales bacterium]
MATYGNQIQTLALHGEIVEILEDKGRRLAKIVLTAPVVVDMTNQVTADAHLGDRVVVRGWIAAVSGHKEDV